MYIFRRSLIIGIISFFCITSFAHATDLAFSPATGSISGDSIVVDVVVKANTQPINAVSGSISFPSALLSVSSVTKSGSIVSLWAEEPSYSNTVGTIHFEGVILNPGFSSATGKILSIRFTKKAGVSGTAKLTFTDGAVLANDGQATNVLGNFGSATFTVAGAPAPVPNVTQPDIAPVIEMTPTPVIASTTHPNQDGWSANNVPVFSWNVPAGVTAVRLGYGKSETAAPIRTYTSVLTEKSLDVLSDGTYYFAAQFKNAAGWGAVARYKFSIDTVAPDTFTITQSGEASRPTLSFSTIDTGSGIERYAVIVDNGAPINIAAADGASTYQLPENTGSGMHYVKVQAIDRAGNATEASIPVYIPVAENADIAVSLPVIDRLPFGMSNTTALLILLASITLLLIAILWLSVIRFAILKRRVRRDISTVTETLKDDFLTLREHIDLHSGHITGRSKTKAIADKVFKNSRDTIDLVERDIEHKLEKISKHL